MDSSAPSILWSRVRIPSLPSILFTFIVQICTVIVIVLRTKHRQTKRDPLKTDFKTVQFETLFRWMMNKVSKYSLKVFLLFHYSVTLWQHLNSKSYLHFTRNFQKTKNIIFVLWCTFSLSLTLFISLPPSVSSLSAIISTYPTSNPTNISSQFSIIAWSVETISTPLPPPQPTLHYSISLSLSRFCFFVALKFSPGAAELNQRQVVW